jgi:hypothetical protein
VSISRIPEEQKADFSPQRPSRGPLVSSSAHERPIEVTKKYSHHLDNVKDLRRNRQNGESGEEKKSVIPPKVSYRSSPVFIYRGTDIRTDIRYSRPLDDGFVGGYKVFTSLRLLTLLLFYAVIYVCIIPYSVLNLSHLSVLLIASPTQYP